MSFDLSFPHHSRNALTDLSRSAGQAVVEFTLMFLLFLVIAWIPADFGLALYTGQLAQNAAREGTRIAAADPTLVSGLTSCTMPSCSGNIFQQTASRISSALLPGATITLNLDPDTGSNCNRMVTVAVSGTYHYCFYQLLRALGQTPPDSVNIDRSSTMRWEHQAGCGISK